LIGGTVAGLKERLVPALVAGIALLTAAAPSAAAVAINGDPLQVYANTNSKLQARFVGFDDGEFDDPAIDFPNAGLKSISTSFRTPTRPPPATA
jgi:hypothetical protein